MKTTRRTYVLTINGPSKKGLQLWTGKSLHALRHCSEKQLGQTLQDIREDLDSVRPPRPAFAPYSFNRGR
ncbi:hypothetical protein [Petrachloros mirabilis]